MILKNMKNIKKNMKEHEKDGKKNRTCMKPFWKTIKSVFDEKEYKSAANEFSKTAYLH